MDGGRLSAALRRVHAGRIVRASRAPPAMRALLAMLLAAGLLVGCAGRDADGEREVVPSPSPAGAPIAVTPSPGDSAPTPTPTQSPSPSTFLFEDGFEDATLDGWETGRDVPGDAATGSAATASVASSEEKARTGGRSAGFAIDGHQDGGTVWLVRGFEVEAGRVYDVHMDVWAHGEASAHARGDVVLFAGDHAPRGEADFGGRIIGPGAHASTRSSLDGREGWRPADLSWTTPVLGTDLLFVALGVSASGEAATAGHLDDLRVRITPV